MITRLARILSPLAATRSARRSRPEVRRFRPELQPLDDRVVPSVTPSTYKIEASRSVTEGQSTNFTVSRFGDLTQEQTVTFSIKNGLALNGKDFTVSPAGGAITFAKFAATQTITINTVDDDIYEKPETFQITLTGVTGGGQLKKGATTGVCTINDNDTKPVFFWDTIREIKEGDSPRKIKVTLTHPTYEKAMVKVALSSGSKTARVGPATDCHLSGLSGGAVVFQPGETEAYFYINVRDDSIIEDKEQFKIKFSAGAGVQSAAYTEVLDVYDNDVPAFSIDNHANVTEGSANHPIYFNIKLVDQTTERPLTVVYQTENGSAVAGEDYLAVTNGKVEFPVSAKTGKAAVTIRGDKGKAQSKNETFYVKLLPRADYTLVGNTKASCTIVDDD